MNDGGTGTLVPHTMTATEDILMLLFHHCDVESVNHREYTAAGAVSSVLICVPAEQLASCVNNMCAAVH